ncbi:MAG: RHS repeat protein, partial [Planctomycetaceae bacterium]|nr:RHS repeat protein [Planctomycetaceae bacterium]
MRRTKSLSASLVILVVSTVAIQNVSAQSPRNVFEWTPEKVVEQAWLAERDEFAANVYVHSPERGFVQTGAGSYHLPMTDLVIPVASAELRIERLYDSNSAFRGVFGIGWHSSLDAVLRVNKNNIVEVNIGGVPYRFQSDPASPTHLKPLQTATASLTKAANGQYDFTSADGRRSFTADGKLIEWQKQGTTFEFAYQGKSLSQIRAGAQSLLNIKSTENGLIEQLADATDRTLQFQYDQAGHLTQATHVDRTTETYQFNSAGQL